MGDTNFILGPKGGGNISFVQELVVRFPGLTALLEEHVKDYDEILPHVFFGDVTRYAASLGVVVKGESGRASGERDELSNLLQFLEESYSSGHSEVQNLIYVSFLENLGPDAGEAQVRELLGPELSRQMRVIEGLGDEAR